MAPNRSWVMQEYRVCPPLFVLVVGMLACKRNRDKEGVKSILKGNSIKDGLKLLQCADDMNLLLECE